MAIRIIEPIFSPPRITGWRTGSRVIAEQRPEAASGRAVGVAFQNDAGAEFGDYPPPFDVLQTGIVDRGETADRLQAFQRRTAIAAQPPGVCRGDREHTGDAEQHRSVSSQRSAGFPAMWTTQSRSPSSR